MEKKYNTVQNKLKPYADYKFEVALEIWQRHESALEGTFQHFWRRLVCPIAADEMITFQSNPAEALWKESSHSAAQGTKQAGQKDGASNQCSLKRSSSCLMTTSSLRT